MRVKCLAQEHNTMSPARARIQTAQFVVERTNHYATATPFSVVGVILFFPGPSSLMKEVLLCD